MRDTEIDFMDFEAAREYVLAFITTLKKTQKDRAICEEEKLDLKRKVDVLKEKLKAAKIRSSLKVDADALLAQMQMLVGEPDSLTEQLRSEEAGQALELLKKRMEEEKNR
jgi:pyruvate/oxaloacetate carboxyltransferase